MQSDSLLTFSVVDPESANPNPTATYPEFGTRFGNGEERWELLMSNILQLAWNATRQ
eukprot:gene19539-23365_t